MLDPAELQAPAKYISTQLMIEFNYTANLSLGLMIRFERKCRLQRTGVCIAIVLYTLAMLVEKVVALQLH